MKVIICDVGDAACALVTCSNGHTMMIDCGSKSDKENPVDVFKNNKQWLGSVDYITRLYARYPITLLHITHPDDDHVRNSKRVVEEIPPYLVKRNNCIEYDDKSEINTDYRLNIDNVYNGTNPEAIEWGFDINKTWSIPTSICKTYETLNNKVRNNSSIVRYIKDNGVGILFCGDLERPGWEYLATHNSDFVSTMKTEGVDILIAPHHGHKSGFPKALFDIIGSVSVVIHSKDTEASKEGTDVSSQYSSFSKGVCYFPLSDNSSAYFGRVLTTRSNGHIFIDTSSNILDCGKIWTQKASPNHDRIR